MENNTTKEIEGILVKARCKTEEQVSKLSHFSPSSLAFVQSHTNTAFAFCLNHLKITELNKELMLLMSGPLVHPMQQLNACYIDFYAAFGVNVGVFSAIISSFKHVLPKCVGNSEQFRELCKIMSTVIKQNAIDTTPLVEKLKEATIAVGSAIVEIQNARNLIQRDQEGNNILKSYEKIAELRRKIESVMMDIHQNEAKKVFLQENSANSKRIVEYLKKRISLINEQIEKIEIEIQKFVTTQTPVRSALFHFIKMEVTSLQLLQQRKYDLLSERKKIEEEIRVIMEKGGEVRVLCDTTEKKNELVDLKELLKKEEERHQNAVQAYFKAAAMTGALKNEEAQKMASVLNLLNIINLRVIAILKEIDVTSNIIFATLTNQVLEPANIVLSLGNIFQFSVMSEILRTNYLSICSSKEFDQIYLKFTEERADIQLLALQEATPAFVAKQDDIIAQKKSRLACAGWE